MSESSTSGGPKNPELLGIYLNDHLMAATGGVELVRRMIGVHRGTRWEHPLEGLLAQLLEERTSLRAIMQTFGVPVRRYKQAATWAAEKASRLKLNGHLLSRSPLSSIIEFEFIANAVLGKRAGFETLRELAETDSRLDKALLDQLINQADEQHEWLTEARREVAAEVFGGRPEPASEVAGN